MVNFGEVRRTQLAKSTPLTSTLVTLESVQIFYGLFRCKERVGFAWHLIIPSKTTVFVPEFAVEDLPSAEPQTWFLPLQ